MADGIKTVQITDMDLRGRGIGKYDGKAVFIQGAVTGDTVSYEISESKKRYDIGKLREVVIPSSHRVIPSCSAADKCGGCAFLHVDRETELDIKLRAVEAAFRRAGIHDIKANKIISGTDCKYRNKVIFHLNDDGRYGFYESASHTSVSCDSCIVVPDILLEIIKYTEAYFAENKETTPPENIMLRIGNDEVMLCSQTDLPLKYTDYHNRIYESISCIKSVYECNGYPGSYESKFLHILGSRTISCDFGNVTLNISPESFFQVNTEVADALCNEIADNLSPDDGDTILDLYCGIGTIGLRIADRFRNAKIIGVEINENAVEDAIENAMASGISNAEFICHDAGKFDITTTSPYAVIVDPPRYGLTPSMILQILRIKPKILVYMSCNSSTLAGDSLKLIDGGYSISYCVAADMFPHAPHMESLIIFKLNQ